MIEHREYQHRLIDDALSAFNAGCRDVLIVSPCGSGKTITSLLLLKELQKRMPLRVGWTAMRHKLLQQAMEENRQVGVRDIDFISMFNDSPPQCDLLVCDEAQHEAATSCAVLRKRMGADLSLGLTSTPFRTDRVRLSFDKIISDYGVRFLIEKGYLCNFDQYVIPIFTPESVTTRIIAEPERWGKTIVYMPDEASCWKTRELLLAKGIPTDVILGKHSFTKRDEIYSRFESGQTQVLINIYLLSEGFDCPDLRTVFVRDTNKLCTIQMSGRCLRKDPADPSKVANVVQSEKTPFPYTKVTKARHQLHWIEKDWCSIDDNELAQKVASRSINFLMSTPVKLPKYLLEDRKKIRATWL